MASKNKATRFRSVRKNRSPPKHNNNNNSNNRNDELLRFRAQSSGSAHVLPSQSKQSSNKKQLYAPFKKRHSSNEVLDRERLHKRTPSQSVMVRLKRLDTLRLNQRIRVKDYGFGSIQFLGCVHFAQGLFVGVDLDEANGKHDGSILGKRYFTCKSNHGVLVKQHKVELLDLDTVHESMNSLGHTPRSVSGASFGSDLFNELRQFSIEIHDENDAELSKSNTNSNMHTPVNGGNGNNGNKSNNNQRMAVSAQKQEKLMALRDENDALKNELDMFITNVDEMEVNVEDLQRKNDELMQEKSHFSDEMNHKIDELNDQLLLIRTQIVTKDQVLKKQISMMESTKGKIKKKIRAFEELKLKDAQTRHLIYYGEHDETKNQDESKDILIENWRNEENEQKMELEKYKELLRNEKRDCKELLNEQVRKWMFDFGDVSKT